MGEESVKAMAEITNQDIRGILEAIKDNKTTSYTQLAELDRKMDDLPNKFDQLRREFQTSQSDLRRELVSMFVHRAEYDPKHAVLVDRVSKNETLIERVDARVDTKYNELDTKTDNRFKDLEKKSSDKTAKVLATIGTVIAIGGFAMQFMQHISIR